MGTKFKRQNELRLVTLLNLGFKIGKSNFLFF